MATKKKTAVKKKRKASPAQLAALAKGRAKIAKKRKPSSTKKPSARRKTKPAGTSVVVIQPSQERKVMAKKKTSGNSSAAPRKKSTARRGLSGLKGKAKGMIPIVKDVAFAVAGGVAAGALANKLPIADNRLKAAAPVLAGILLAGTMGKKNAMMREVGTGMAIIGAIGLIKQLLPNVPVLAGEDQVFVIPDDSSYAGEMMQLGYDDNEDYMGEMMQLGNESYLSPASM